MFRWHVNVFKAANYWKSDRISKISSFLWFLRPETIDRRRFGAQNPVIFNITPVAASYCATFAEFVKTDSVEILQSLHKEHAINFSNFQTAQHGAWVVQLPILSSTVRALIEKIPASSTWGVLLEYDIPGRGKRLDAVILSDRGIIPIEFKIGAKEFRSEDCWQLLIYSWNLRDFHRESKGCFVAPILVATDANQSFHLNEELRPSDRQRLVFKMQLAKPQDLAASVLHGYSAMPLNESSVDINRWNHSQTEPTENIIQAAQRLFGAHDVREIDHAHSDNTDSTVDEIFKIIADAKQNHRRSICFVTGVPGAGKTLVGLRAVYSPRMQNEIGAPACFASGNNPLIKVLTRALEVNRTKQKGTRRVVNHEVGAPFWNVHRFAATHLTDQEQRPPPFRVVIFDEAQRVWSQEKVLNSQKERQRRQGTFDKLPESLWNHSEPELLLEVMERYQDWCVIIALVGGGQEIHDGEAGLAEWGRALAKRKDKWTVWSSPIALKGGSTLSGKTLFADALDCSENALICSNLHLSVTKRSARAERLTEWVDHVLCGKADEARKISNQLVEFPIRLVRSIDSAKELLRNLSGPDVKCGLLASSKANRLRADGIEVNKGFRDSINFPDWFVQPQGRIDSSNQLEVAATEFECQGLELDWTCVCWGNDFVFDGQKNAWDFWRPHGIALRLVASLEERELARNKYRVLLTRAREGMILFVPCGDPNDSTRLPRRYDDTYNFLKRCGLQEISARTVLGGQPVADTVH